MTLTFWYGEKPENHNLSMHLSCHLLLSYLYRKIWEEREAAFTLSTKGLFTLELFSNLHSVFTNHDFHFVSCDRVLSWEVCAVFHRINEKLIQPTLPTPKTDKIFNSLHSNLNNNVLFILGD